MQDPIPIICTCHLGFNDDVFKKETHQATSAGFGAEFKVITWLTDSEFHYKSLTRFLTVSACNACF